MAARKAGAERVVMLEKAPEADYGGNPMPVFAAWLALGGICLVSLWLLSRRIRAYEVVR